MKSDPKQNRRRPFTISIVCRLLALIVALSFLATLLPIGIVSAEKSTMACCVGKAAGHCDSGLTSKKQVPAHDHVTVVAEQTENKSPSVSTVSQHCQSDCCACAVSTQQQRRERAAVQPIAWHAAPSATLSRFASIEPFFSSNDEWAQTSPRGPPSFLR